MKISFKAFDNWYDRLNEPWRVLFAMIVVGGGLISPITFPRESHPHLLLFALTWFGFIVFWALYRLRWLIRRTSHGSKTESDKEGS